MIQSSKSVTNPQIRADYADLLLFYQHYFDSGGAEVLSKNKFENKKASQRPNLSPPSAHLNPPAARVGFAGRRGWGGIDFD